MMHQIDWHFPLPRTHTGVPLGNGRTGVLVWGEGNRLCITIGRADLWDHRGGLPWTADQSYTNIWKLLEANDAAGIEELFRPSQSAPEGTPRQPTVLPFGRIELTLHPACRLQTARLALMDGTVTVTYTRGSAHGEMHLLLHPESDVAVVRGTTDVTSITPVTSWDLMREKLEAVGHTAPVTLGLETEAVSGGWFWDLPNDPGAWVAWRLQNELVVAVGRSGDSTRAATAASAALEISADDIEEQSIGWWRRYWRGVASVDLPNRHLQEIHDFGIYLFAGLTNPTGVAATLQGPWIEEYDYPPWSSDYHFNINVQMCYSPAFRSGALDHLRPLFDLVWSWRETLAENARLFAGVSNGYMLPHAVDDRGLCMGAFWTGAVDHGCTAWVAQMMYDYSSYSGDDEFLRDRAFPFMKGAFEVYRAMLEDDADELAMSVSVSPEYRGRSINAWGRNASFQLAALHRLCDNLAAAAARLGESADPRWAEVANRLPEATLIGDPGEQRIALWEGTDLEESHRHHSHLASIVPFSTIDPEDPAWRPVVERSLQHWVARGMGLWSGWCMSWASQIHSRVGNGEGAELMLELWRRVFTNEGRASMHDAVSNGVTLMGAPPFVRTEYEDEQERAEASSADRDAAGPSSKRSTPATILRRAERMQMDGAMGGVAAVQEMLLHDRRGTIHVFPAIPADWSRASFERMRTPGGFIVSGWWRGPQEWRIEIEATQDARLRVAPPAAAYKLIRESGVNRESGTFESEIRAGSRVTLTSVEDA